MKTIFPKKLYEDNQKIYAEFEEGVLIDQIEQDQTNLIINREWNLNYNGQINLPFKLTCEMEPSFFLIPGVVVNGNKFGKGNYPQFDITEKHSFREDRVAIPSGGIIENSTRCIGIFSAPAGNEEFVSSISLHQVKKTVNMEICIPWEEQPNRYVAKIRRIKGITNFFTLNGVFNYNRKFFVCYRNVTPESKGYGEILHYAWKTLTKHSKLPRDWSDWMRKKTQLTVNVFYAKAGRAHGFVTTIWNPFIPLSASFSGGFIGKSIEIAYCLYRMYLINKMENLREIALNVTNFMTSNTLPNGLFFSDYSLTTHRWYGYRLGGRKELNTRIMGEITYILLKFYSKLKEQNEVMLKWLKIVKNFCDFMVVNQQTSGSFGKWWSQSGNLVEDSGTNGAYVIWTLVELFKLTKEKKYYEAAIKAGNYYILKFVQPDEYWGDTLDANAIDKEAGHAILRAMLLLYEITRENKFLIAAKRAGHFVSSWQIIYDIPFPKGSDLDKRHFKTCGGSIVSVENMHTDPYILFTLDFLQLWKYTQDNYWKERAIAGLQFALQMVASEHDTQGYKEWFVGWQPEQFNHTTWGYYNLNSLFPYKINPKGKFAGNITWVLAATMGTVIDIAEEFPDLIEIHPFPIKMYDSIGFKISKKIRDILLRLNPLQ